MKEIVNVQHTPERKADVFAKNYKDSGFENVDGVWKIVPKRVNLDKLLGEDVKTEGKLSDTVIKENSNIGGNTTVADFTGFDKDSDKKRSALVGFYNNRQEKIQKAKITEIGK